MVTKCDFILRVSCFSDNYIQQYIDYSQCIIHSWKLNSLLTSVLFTPSIFLAISDLDKSILDTI